MDPLLLITLAAALAAPPPIIGGDETAAYPAAAALTATDGRGHIVVCSGVLVRPRWVLSAAHCIEELDSLGQFLTIQAVFGESLSGSGELPAIDIDDRFPHPEWRAGVFDYDVALFHLAERAPVDPLPLAADERSVEWVGAELQLVGWGDTDQAGSNDGRKRTVGLEVETQDGWFLRARDGLGDANLCYGDSGGPALDDSVDPPAVVGVAAFVFQDDDSGGCVGGGTGVVRARVFGSWLNARIDGDPLLGGAPAPRTEAGCAGGTAAGLVLGLGLWGAPRRRRRSPAARRDPHTIR